MLGTKSEPFDRIRRISNVQPTAESKITNRFRTLLSQSEAQAKSFRWAQAAKTCGQCLNIIPRGDLSRKARTLELIGLYRYYSGMQSNTRAGFRRRLNEAIARYTSAQEIFSGLRDEGRTLRCEAMLMYLAHWVAKSTGEKKRFLDKSWQLSRKSLLSFEASKRDAEYADTYIELSLAAALAQELHWDVESRVRLIYDAIGHGRKSIGILRSIGNSEQLTKGLVRTALFLDALIDCISNQEKISEYQKEALHLWEDALKTSRDGALRESCRPPQGFYRILSPPESLELSKEALRIVRPQRDNFEIGWVLDHLTKWTFYAAESTENEALARSMHREALHFAEEAAERYDLINFTSPIAGVYWVHSPYLEFFMITAGHETDPERKRLLREKSHSYTKELVRLAAKSEHPQIIHYSFHASSRSAFVLADSEPNIRRRKELLREALKYRIKGFQIIDRIDPVLSWNRSTSILNLAETQARLAGIETNLPKHKRLLTDASTNYSKGLKWGTAMVEGFENHETHLLNAQLGKFRREYGDMLLQLHSITHDPRYLENAAKEYSTAVDCYKGIGRHKRLAESYWKAAETYDRLKAYSLAAENFALASEAYETLGKQFPSLRQSCRDYSYYMKAWSHIENARSNHFRFRYETAASLFKAVAQLHRSTRRWSFLAPYYSAWSELELGENLSKLGQRTQAIDAFRKAAELFQNSRVLSKQRLSLLDQEDERAMVTHLVNVPSEAYCQARIVLEEAIIAESLEEYWTSFEKFGLAADKLQAFSQLSEQGQDRRETSFLSALCKAWKLSDKAELEDSTKPLQRAVKILSAARKTSADESARKLAAGHEAFCKGIIASRTFAKTLDQRHYAEASRRFDSAVDYYRDAGFRTASDNATARKLLLDASVHLNEANIEQNQEKKAESFRLASALLRESAEAFLKAQQPKKRERTLGLLEKARTESEIALRLTEILRAASGAPGNVAFPSPAHGDEKAVGLDRFERSDIEVKVTSVTRLQGLRQDIELALEILNVGERPVTLVKIAFDKEDAVLLDHRSVEAGEPRGAYPRRIRPASADGMKLTIRPHREGLVKLDPRILFVDERGSEREKPIESILVATSPMIEYLGESFLADYLERRLAQQSSGWRTMMDIVNSLKIPRSHVYGEPRYGRMFGRQLESLVKSSLVEYRIFPGERGRGGEITKIRVLIDNENVKGYLQQLTSRRGNRILPAVLSPNLYVETSQSRERKQRNPR